MKFSEPTRIGNFQRGFATRGAQLVLPALLSILALGGVTARPALDITAARAALSRSAERVRLYETELALNERYEAEQLLPAATELLAHARAKIPEECSSVVAHGVVRIAAANVGMQFEQLQVALDKDVGVEQLDKPIAALQVSLGGTARVAQITALIDELKRLGFPTCVFEVSLRRAAPAEREFEFHLDLGLLHFTHARHADAPSGPQEQP